MSTIFLSGVTFHQDVVEGLHIGQRLYLRREPQNKFDPNAIRVEDADGLQVGFIPKETAAQMAPVIDETGQYPTAKVSNLTEFRIKGQGFTGVEIFLGLPES